ncbi:MAG: hypothetical protein NUV81_02095 [bacterium]|nr:hypothetical protein [bacterium]
MKMKSLLRLEWISLVYLVLFVLAVLSPSLVTKGYFGIDERHIEEFAIFLFGIVGMSTFSLYERIMEKKDKEHEDAKNEYERARRELVESYKYIGSINRKIEVLKGIANQTSVQIGESQRVTKELLTSLLASAATSAGAEHAMLRYILMEGVRTEHEVVYRTGDDIHIRIPNKRLIQLLDEHVPYSFIKSDGGHDVLVVPSDHEGKSVKAFLLLVVKPEPSFELDTSLLKVFANQAGLLYYTHADSQKQGRGVLDLIGEVEENVRGVVN